ncbi:MAG TPA: hypothetical protein VGO58_02270, partial [Chitinophagaceae bacterium]|nr:hypothetical protein [Chitinophagaceae bacterium]
MEQKLLKQVRSLKFIVLILVVFNSFMILSSFNERKGQKGKFDELDVKRLNLIEEDGKTSLIIANKKKLPGAITNGRVLSDAKGQRGPGLLFYNDEGDECGGYLFGNWGTHFSMDQLKQDQAVYMQVINGNKDEPLRTAGFWVTPQSYLLSSDVMDRKMDSINTITDKSERDKARTNLLQGLDKYNKAFMGKNRDDDTGLFLFDKNFNTRMRLYVDTLGNPKLEFIDE